jgi:hypothetical protein
VLPPELVVARCRKGTPSRSASAGATTLPPAPYEADTVTSLARSELISSPFVSAAHQHLPLILDEYRGHYNTHPHTDCPPCRRNHFLSRSGHHAHQAPG